MMRQRWFLMAQAGMLSSLLWAQAPPPTAETTPAVPPSTTLAPTVPGNLGQPATNQVLPATTPAAPASPGPASGTPAATAPANPGLPTVATPKEAPVASKVMALSDGRRVSVLIKAPAAPVKGGWPLCILLPPGTGAEPLAQTAMEMLGHELAKHDWAVAIPISPDGKSFFGDNGTLVPLLAETLQRSPGIRKGKVLLAGISNGGSSALEIASRNSDRIMGVVAVPGMLTPATVVSKLKDMPIFLRVGAQDELRWAETFNTQVRTLGQASTRLDAKLVENGKHAVKVDWTELALWLAVRLETTPAR